MTLRGKTKTAVFTGYGYKLGLLVLLSSYLIGAFLGPVSAAQLTPRSLTLEAGATDAGSMPGGTVKHTFDFTIATTDDVGSITFEYCTTASGTCTAPTGLDVDGVTLDNQSGTGATGFSVDATLTTTDTIVIDRTPATINSTTAASYTFGSADNPTGTNETFYVRITTTDDEDGGGSTVDTGTVAASTATQITLTGTMPESLIFCTGETINLNLANVPDCSTATSGSISFNQLFSPAATAIASSQMAASTNADFGYNITVNGATLTSGSNTITAIGASGTASTTGIRQFGMNLRANTTPSVGSNVNPAANGTNLKGQAIGDYATVDQFAFQSGDSVADSGNGGSTGPTDGQLYTISYIANVSGGQPTGTYTTTLTYICTPTF